MGACADDFRIIISIDGPVARVAVFGEVDALTAPELSATLDEALTSAVSEVVVDCRGLTFMDSSGLSVLVTTHSRLREAGGELVVEAPSAAIRRLFDISGIDKVLTIRE